MSRLAGRVWDGYRNNLWVQDLIETAVMALGVAGAQALFTEMTPEEIATSGAIGFGAGMGGRPLGHVVGKHVGRWADQAAPEHSAQLRAKMDKAMSNVEEFGQENMAAKHMSDLVQAKMNQHLRPGAGAFEAAMSYVGRQRGDNIAQAGVGLLSPLVMGGEEQAA